ncbi:macrophage mannose receptor 1 isoform X2 [Syngnathus acus]|uniref:macrophage mannose receptor 1 isoform X2 n=1 Tax=Syngnathus acus TaxID=161584 RepID=UPI00188614FE|nr:macrophage mannose receptor 1 isoform X2 [Syngnathus acus]
MKWTRTLLLISEFCSIILAFSNFHYIALKKTHEEAKDYCRLTHTDLATINNVADMSDLIASVPNDTVRAWIGLELGDVSRWHWAWPNQKVDFFNWKVGNPQGLAQHSCAAMDSQGEWFESECETKRSFVCHSNSDAPSNYIFVANTKSWRDAQKHCRDLSLDLVSVNSAEENKEVRNMSTAQNIWIGLFRDSWRWSDGSESSFRYWKQQQPNNRDQDCVAAVFKDGGQWNDLKCGSQHNFVCQGQNLLLIRENMTWMDALSYCREHYMDLVYITGQRTQDQVAQMAQNATSSHVWLGLRYTCTFDLWFWSGSASDCYQNWAPGQGPPERAHECGVTGAMLTTGRQQWVGLPETQQLNFICQDCPG